MFDEISHLRTQLEALVLSGRTTYDPEVVAVSQKMDRLVLMYYKDELPAVASHH